MLRWVAAWEEGFRKSGRRQFPKLAILLIRNDVKRTVRSLSHVTHPLAPIRERVFFACDTVVLDDESDETHLLERTDEEVYALS